MSIQRWKFLTLADDNGDLVTYTDHVAALAEAEQLGYVNALKWRMGSDAAWQYWFGQGLDAAREAVAALAGETYALRQLAIRDALAAIDGIAKGEQA